MDVLFVLFVLIAFWTLLFGWKRISIGHRSVLAIFGTRLPVTLDAGWKLIPLPGIFQLIEVDERLKDLKITVNYIWSRSPKDPPSFLGGRDRLHLQAEVHFGYWVIHENAFLAWGGESELISMLDGTVVEQLRDEVSRGPLDELLSRRGQKRILQTLKRVVDARARNQGALVTTIWLTVRVMDGTSRPHRLSRI